MEIIWTDFAIENLKVIFDFYAFKVNRKVAHKIRSQILKHYKTARKSSFFWSKRTTSRNVGKRIQIYFEWKL